MHYLYILCVYSHDMSSLNVYVKADDKVKLLRKSRRLGVSVSKLMVESALNFEPDKNPEKEGVRNVK